MPDVIRAEEADVRGRIVVFLAMLPVATPTGETGPEAENPDTDTDTEEAEESLTGEIGEWVESYISCVFLFHVFSLRTSYANACPQPRRNLLKPLEHSTPLWEVWYTGQTPFPTEVCLFSVTLCCRDTTVLPI